jgi:hypothetical protein
MGMADDNYVLIPLSRGGIVSVPVEDFDDPFSEWDENAPLAQMALGSQSHALPAMSRTVTLDDPVTTAILAKASRRPAGETLEEALRALADGIPLLIPSD